MSDWAIKCNYCGRHDQEFKRCTKCYSVHYCSKACQTIDWPNHKKTCYKIKTPKGSGIRNKGNEKPDTCESMSEPASVKKVMTTDYDLDKLKESQAERTSHDKNQTQENFESTTSETSKIKGHGTAASSKTGIPCEKQASGDELSGNDQDKKKQDNNFKKEGICRCCLSEGSKLRCTRCSNTFYCSKVCQKEDWRRHKNVCEGLQRKKEKRTSIKNLQTNNAESSKDSAGVAGATGGAKRCDSDEKEPVGICIKCEKPGCSKRCSRCREVFYCSRQCQQEDWSKHKQVCKQFQNRSERGGRRQPDISERVVIINKITEIDDTDNNITEDKSPSPAQKKIGPCNECHKPSCSKVCTRCTTAFYCSQACQKKDWPRHKVVCERKYTTEERKIIEERQYNSIFIPDEGTWHSSLVFVLSPEQALVNESRPPGSLEKAIMLAKVFYPLHGIVTTFHEVPPEPAFVLDTFLMQNRQCVLVAFINKYHGHVVRHGVYIKDDIDFESMVQFYLEDDNPYPFFTYAKVKPGNYICIESPLIHVYKDGTLGFKILHPQKVKILEKSMFG